MRRGLGALITLCVCFLAGGCADGDPVRPALPPVDSSASAMTSEEKPGAVRVRPERIVLRDITDAAGVTCPLITGASGAHYMVETMLGGIGWIDFDSDGDLDLYVALGHEDPLHADRLGTVGNRLFINQGAGRFKEAPKAAGANDHRYSHGVATGDIDNDGDTDLLVTNFGRNTLYRNDGGKFTDISESAGMVEEGYNMSAVFFDMDRDGDLDLYIARYLQYHPGSARPCMHGEKLVYCGPRYFEGQHDLLYRNEGAGKFVEVGATAGIAAPSVTPGKSLGVISLDFDRDGWLDIYVACDTTPNLAWRNQQDGTFREVGYEIGLAVDIDGKAQAGMGIDCGDVDANGLADILVTNFAKEKNTLYVAEEDGLYHDRSGRSRLGGTFAPLGFGVAMVDLDLDGALDLLFANGHVDDLVETHGEGSADLYAQSMGLLLGDGAGRFEQMDEQDCALLLRRFVGRGLAPADFDGDGDLDLALMSIDRGLVLLANETPRGTRHFLVIRLVGAKSPRCGAGARVRLTVDGRTHEAISGTARSYLSAATDRLHFGLGNAKNIERITVIWPSGSVSTLEQVQVDQEIVIEEVR